MRDVIERQLYCGKPEGKYQPFTFMLTEHYVAVADRTLQLLPL